MIDATSGSVIDDRPAGTTKLVIEVYAGGKRKEPNEDAHHQVLRGAGAVTFKGKYVFAGPKHRFDPLADGSKVWPSSFLIGPGRTDDGATQSLDLVREVFPRIPFVTDDGLSAFKRAGEQKQRHLPFRLVGWSQLDSPGSPIRRAEQMQTTSPEPAGMAARISIAGDIGKGRAPGGFHRTAAFHRGGIKEQEIIVCAGTLRAKDPEEPLDGSGETHPALVKSVLSRKNGEEMPDLPTGGPQEAAVRGEAHEDLSNSQGDDLGIGGLAPGVSFGLWQKIIGRAINDGAEGVEVGVHRGLLVDGVLDTVDFGLSASNPFCATIFVESII